jgi:isoamylase
LRLRREHPVFRRQRFFSGRLDPAGGRRDVGWFGPWGEEMDHAAWHDSATRTLGMFLAGERTGRREASGEPVHGESFLLWLHAGSAPITVTLPGPPWAMAYTVVLDTSESLRVRHYAACNEMELPARSAVLLKAE